MSRHYGAGVWLRGCAATHRRNVILLPLSRALLAGLLHGAAYLGSGLRALGRKHHHCCHQTPPLRGSVVVSKWTQDQKLSSELMSGRLHSAITVWMFLTFMTIHLFQSPFADTEQYWHTSWLVTLTFFGSGNKHVPLVLGQNLVVQCVDAYSVDGTTGGCASLSGSCSSDGSWSGCRPIACEHPSVARKCCSSQATRAT